MELKRLIQITKGTDSFYLNKRGISTEYNPTVEYDFSSWREKFTSEIRSIYENLHKELLYTDEKQSFDQAVETFDKIDLILKEIGE